jgi:hypothetical protein
LSLELNEYRCFFPGFGVFATVEFKKGDILLDYDGVLVTAKEADLMDQTYMYYLTHNGKQFGHVF